MARRLRGRSGCRPRPAGGGARKCDRELAAKSFGNSVGSEVGMIERLFELTATLSLVGE